MADWRSTLFKWKGELNPNVNGFPAKLIMQPGKLPLAFAGSWIPSDNPPTTSTDFASGNAFLVRCSNVVTDSFGDILVDFSEGSYQLDNGDGPQSFSDHLHNVLLRCLPGLSDYLAVAYGSTEFGKFLSVGYVHSGGKMLLCRRYVKDSDVRLKGLGKGGTIEALLKAMLDGEVSDFDFETLQREALKLRTENDDLSDAVLHSILPAVVPKKVKAKPGGKPAAEKSSDESEDLRPKKKAK